ncbi:PREDICTED: uncharacterized protein LOC104804602 [Tarenaya hassleriana]|uniref:uncharacterized protein LOC104804602 n=1 Tax=Tarenaya hassleriana TaxID=28532 RepID=UPI00053CA7F5|nr:PREDICTED: uncharacterized protein LOC104804602 [Tarenaya hassleriana]XP_010527221.1 PREDICTED: uncharacterized protein LOC104804602 [Tarenaya hassleriana]
MAGVKRKLCSESDDHALLHKELDEVSCPICMDHPHNAVLLLCSSYDKGCRSYICDTSYRHSNCLDRFKKLQSESTNTSTDTPEVNLALRSNLNWSQPEGDTARTVSFNRLTRNLDSEGIYELGDSTSLRRVEQEQLEEQNQRMNLKCPHCRGNVSGWKVVEKVRNYLNSKTRSCSRESCSFTGNYLELRRHARRVHPKTRPSDIDPSREREWQYLENQREYGDIVSAIRSTMPGAVVVGDYVIENGDRFSREREDENSGDLNTPWRTTLFLFQMIGSLDHGGSGSRTNRPRAWRNRRRASERRYLWGENVQSQSLQEVHGNDMSPVPRRRRRLLARSRSGNGRPQ